MEAKDGPQNVGTWPWCRAGQRGKVAAQGSVLSQRLLDQTSEHPKLLHSWVGFGKGQKGDAGRCGHYGAPGSHSARWSALKNVTGWWDVA